MMLIELFNKLCSIAIIAGPMRNTSPLLAQKAKKIVIAKIICNGYLFILIMILRKLQA